MKELTNCPFCKGDLIIKTAKCSQCHTEIRGDFRFSRFHMFDKEQLYFIEIFLKNEGNIKLVEKELGISYPTVKNKLQKVIKTLGYTPHQNADEKKDYKNEVKKERLKVLNDLSKGLIDTKDAIEKIGELK